MYLSGEDGDLLSTRSDTPSAALLQSLRSRAEFEITESTLEVGEAHDTTLRLADTTPENLAAGLAAFYAKVLAKG